MARTLLILAVSIFVVTNGFLLRRNHRNWNGRFRGRQRCSIYGTKAVIDEHGLVKSCVYHCGPNHQEAYSYVYGEYCKQLPYGCKDSGCTQCREGFFYLPYPLFFGTRCKRDCPKGYFKDHSRSRCEKSRRKEGCADVLCYKCNNGYYKHVDENYQNRCVTKCPEGYGPFNGRCRSIPEGCLTANCSECRDGYFYYEGAVFFQKCRESCPIGFHPDHNLKACIPCGDVNCNQCDEVPFKCNKCRSPYSLLVDGKESEKHCFTACPEGYVRSFDYQKFVFVCESIEGKKEVTTTTEPAYTTIPNTTPQEVTTTAEPTTAPIASTLEEIKTKKPIITTKGQEVTTNPTTAQVTTTTFPLPEGCSDQECTQCSVGYYRLVTHGKSGCLKSCPGGFYKSTSECLACSEPRCSSCSKSPFQCESCKTGFFQFSSNGNETVKCLDKCPLGYQSVKKNGTIFCEKEPIPDCAIEDCETCASHELHGFHIGCLECKAGYLLKRNIFKDQCVAVCPDSFYAGVKPGTNISACLDCDVQFCQKCIKRKKCAQCFEPFVFDFKKAKCTLCPSGTIYKRITRSCKSVIKKGGGKPITIEGLISSSKKKKMGIKKKTVIYS
ncbi:proprotein convertase subtilisin/kexin type 5-like isoform X2 [Rhopilema esculentum]|uniref:proprotein convertase subtilisin/kexin type 5-like isoform X2 n=1 Tax=Rhopilema esculentum TaxID=499914 RepID=UPI0031D666AE